MSFEILKIKIKFDAKKEFPLTKILDTDNTFRKRSWGYKLTSVIMSKQEFELNSGFFVRYMDGKKIKKDMMSFVWDGDTVMVFTNDYQEVGTATLNYKEDKKEIKVLHDYYERKQKEKAIDPTWTKKIDLTKIN